MRLLRGVYAEPVEVLAMTVRGIFKITCTWMTETEPPIQGSLSFEDIICTLRLYFPFDHLPRYLH
jgi:hypothetical protein